MLELECEYDGCTNAVEDGRTACIKCEGFVTLDASENSEAMRDAVARYEAEHRRTHKVHSPAKYDPEAHGAELMELVRYVATMNHGFPEDKVSDLVESDLVDIVVRCHEVLTARRVRTEVSMGVGLAAFVGEGQRVPVKRELRERIESAFLSIADALVAVNRGDLEYLELGQSERAEVTRTRQLRDDIASGVVDMREAMSRLAECFDDRLPTDRPEYGFRPWDPEKVADWASSYACTTQRIIATFMLNLWNDSDGSSEFFWSRFEFFQAMRLLDGRSLNVIRAWMCSQWLP